MFLKMGVVVIIILLLKVISNQQEIDYHICETSREHKFDIGDMIINRGVINRVIWICKKIAADFVYEYKHGNFTKTKESK